MGTSQLLDSFMSTSKRTSLVASREHVRGVSRVLPARAEEEFDPVAYAKALLGVTSDLIPKSIRRNK